MDQILTALLSAGVVGTLVTVLLNLLFKERLERIAQDVRLQSDRIGLLQQSRHAWKEESIAQLLGPINILLARTGLTFSRWREKNLYLEAKIIKESNQRIRDLLLERSHLIPHGLTEDAAKLIEHYDHWLEKFADLRERRDPNLETSFVFSGPDGYPFPVQAANRFQRAYAEVWQEVYGAHPVTDKPD